MHPFNSADEMYETDSLRTGVLFITKLDTVAKRISGTLHFMAIGGLIGPPAGHTKVVQVTNGWFDDAPLDE
jgi:hypothetical protein